MASSKDGKLELLSDKNSVLVLVDYQPSMFKSISSGDKTIIRNAAICAAKAARICGVPVVLSSINPKSMGSSFQKSPRCFRIRRHLLERCRVLTLLRMKEPGALSRKQKERNW